MNNKELNAYLHTLWLQGVELWLENNNLRFRGNKSVMGAATMATLKKHKPQIISLLQEQPDNFSGYPLSHGQRGIHLMQTMAPQSHAYNQTCLLALGPQLDIPALEKSLNALIHRQTILTTRLSERDNFTAQQPHYSLQDLFSIEEHRLKNQKALDTWFDTQADQPFTLDNNPLLRICLLRNTAHKEPRYYLLIVAHHIIADFWALELIISELQQFYQAEVEGCELLLEPLDKNFKDYVVAENDWLTHDDGQTAQTFWQQQLTPLPPTLELPADFTRPAQHQYRGQEFPFSLNKTLTKNIKQQAKLQHITAFVWVLSAYQTLLHRYTGESEITVGSPVAGRTQSAYQKLAGHFTNPVSLCAQFEDKDTFKQLLQNNKQQVFDSMKHQSYPFQCVIEDLKPKRDANNSPIFQVAISWNQWKEFAPSSLVQHVERMEQRGAIYDLVLSCYDKGDEIALSWRYNSDLFTIETIQRFTDHFCFLLEQSCQSPQKKIHDFDISTEAETQLISQINQTPSVIPRNKNLSAIFQTIAQKNPELVAFKYIANDSLETRSYGELEAYSNQLANYLKRQGIKSGDSVALCMNRSFDMLACILGSLKLGCIYIPIDPIYPKERIALILEKSAAAMIICHSQSSKKIRFVNENPLLEIDQQQSDILQENCDFILPNNGDIDEDTVASILFTSGSTGMPKGVQIPHRAICRLAVNNGFCEIKKGDTFCYVSNVSFDATNIEIWGALLNGGSLLYTNTETLLEPQEFADFTEKHRPNAALITTALFNILINYKADIFKHFDTVMVGGEALDIHIIRQCQQYGSPKNLVNTYGPTENGTISTFFPIHKLQESDHSVPIGRANNNSQAYIHDSYGQPCPIGVIGELVVGGDGVSTGYLNQPQLTHEKFIDDFYRGKGLLYATGDLGLLRADGEIIYMGRKDDQVKIRGYRIELGEVEQHLSQHVDIKQCTVIAQKDTLGSYHLAAYFSSTNALSSNEIKAFLKQQLPDFMVPSAFMQLPELPISANGKVDKKRLPEIEIERHHEYLAPRNDTEKSIAQIWSELLNIEDIGIHDNFFELGGHSLLAVNAAGDIKKQLDLNISMRMIFENPSIFELSNMLNENIPQLPSITAQKESSAIPASMAQQRLWFLQQLNPKSSAYNMPVALRFNMPLKASVISFMLKQLIQRHQSLRTAFRDDNGVAFLDIHAHNSWELPTLDFTQLSPIEANEKARLQIEQLSNRAFELDDGPLLKALMIHLNSQEHILVLCLHHTISDGWSVEILLSELGIIWQDISAQQKKNPHTALLKTELPVLEIQYSDFSQWQRQWLQGDVLESQLQYWQKQLSGAPALLNLPTDKTRPAILSSEGSEYHFTINAALTAKLKQLSQDNAATLFMTMLSAYSLLLSRYSQQSDVCIGFPISGRNQPELEPLIGLFVNNLVIRSDLSGNPSVQELIAQIRETTIAAYAHQDVPFDLIVDRLKLERSLSYTPLLQASFSLETQSLADKLEDSLGTSVSIEPLDWNIAKYDINLTCFDSEGDMQAIIEYSTDLYTQDTMVRMSGHFLRILKAMVEHANTPINELRTLTTNERNKLIESWQQQASHNKLTINSINRFEIQAAKFSNNIAVSFEQQAINYKTLNLKANQLAHFLQANGIATGHYVGLYLERSIDVVIAILAILKTGAAYIPLDPHSPKERTNFILSDAKVKHVVSSSNIADDIKVKNIYNIDSMANILSKLPVDNLNTYIPNDSTAYIIYTSGTTGKPKGCLISHANLARLFTTTHNQFQFNEDDVWTLFHSYAFDFSVWEIWGALLYGGRVSIIPQWMTRVPDAFYQHLLEEKVTILNQTPSAFSQLITIDAQIVDENLSLRSVIFGGEALDFNGLSRWIEKHALDDIKLINMYGITETTVHASYHEISSDDILRGRSLIGKPLNDLIIHILDSHGQMAPTGILGEMFISGGGVSQGYLNRPELTAERFLQNPFIQDLPGAAVNAHKRMYRSGDLARRLPNGDIEYLGRIDHQVKIRGYRIELGEIEAALSSLENIQESIVLAREEEAGHKRLIAYMLVEQEEDVDLDQLRQQLRQNLPEYMVPAAFVALTQWPLTANGKVDNMRLPAPQDSNFSTQAYVAPRNDSEQAICLIWADILGIEKVGIYDNFFELGGHSLLATQVASRIRTSLQCSLELKAIFENPTPAELAVVIIEEEIDALDMDDDDLLALLNELDD